MVRLNAPTGYPNPRGDDPWDNDAIYWLLEQPGGERWTRFDLGECLRRQPARIRKQPRRVEEAASLARRHGVWQVEMPWGERKIVRLVRTDRDAPRYPLDRLRALGSAPEVRQSRRPWR